MTNALLVYISCQNTDEAERLSEVLLNAKLAACCSTIPHMNSIFLWPPGKGRFDYAEESLLMVKTLEEKWPDLEKAILKAHSYENPEIIAMPLTHVSKKYLSWLESELS